MTLSKKQKEVIRLMREGNHLMWFYSSQKYRQKSVLGNYHTVLDTTAHVLIMMKLISVIQPEDFIKRFELTELGKTISI